MTGKTSFITNSNDLSTTIYSEGAGFQTFTTSKVTMDAAKLEGIPTYYQFVALSRATEDYKTQMAEIQGLISNMDLTAPFANLAAVFTDESFGESRANFVKFLREDFPEAAEVATPYLTMMTEQCRMMNESLDSLFLAFVRVFGDLLVFLQEITPEFLTLLQEQWQILLDSTNEIWGLIRDSIVGVLQILLASFGTFFSIGTANWKTMWTILSDVSKNTAAKIMEHVSNLVNNFIDRINSLLKFVNGVAGKMGFDLDLNIPKFANGGYVGKTGLALVHEGEFVMSKAMLNGQQATPSSVINKNNQPQITMNVRVSDKVTVEEMVQRINRLVWAPEF